VLFRTNEERVFEDDFVNHNKKKVRYGETQFGNKERVFLLNCMAL
jgi:hypothetical protein